MKKYYSNIIFSVLLIPAFFILGCTSKSDSVLNSSSISDENYIDIELDKAISLFKYLHLPTEMSSIFEHSNADFNEEITNSLENANQYFISSEKAINMGIYGVDMAYLRLFNKTQLSQHYLSTIKNLSEYLGIPGSYFTYALDNINQNIIDKDSLLTIANDIYIASDEFLRENNQETASALIIYGGWIEAIYIALNILDEDKENTEIIANILAQKKSLESLVQLLDFYKNDESVSFYLNKLLLLQNQFDKLVLLENTNFNSQKDIEDYLNSSDFSHEEIHNQLKKIKFIVFDLRQNSVDV